jgi:nucleoside-diphosphate-sugar epimerase
MQGNGPRILVTGATGFLGRALCTYFSLNNYRVQGLSRRSAPDSNTIPDVQFYRGDLPEYIDSAAFEEVDVVIHCAYATQHAKRDEAHEINYKGTALVQSMSRNAGVEKFVFISSTAAHISAEAFYGSSKFKIEQTMDLKRDLIIRPGLIIGHGGTFGQMVNNLARLRVMPLFQQGQQIIQTVYIDDLCMAIEKAIRKQLTGIQVIAEPVGIDMKSFFRRISKQLNISCVFIPLPFTPILSIIKFLERQKLTLPLTSENLLGLKHMKIVASEESLNRLGITLRTYKESIQLFSNQG